MPSPYRPHQRCYSISCRSDSPPNPWQPNLAAASIRSYYMAQYCLPQGNYLFLRTSLPPVRRFWAPYIVLVSDKSPQIAPRIPRDSWFWAILQRFSFFQGRREQLHRRDRPAALPQDRRYRHPCSRIAPAGVIAGLRNPITTLKRA